VPEHEEDSRLRLSGSCWIVVERRGAEEELSGGKPFDNMHGSTNRFPATMVGSRIPICCLFDQY
jgi:hypothetical protein